MKGNILIIDDEDSIRSLLFRLLELEDYRVWAAETAKKGIELLSREEIHVVICDVRLPDASGMDLIPKIKQLHPLCEVILLTAYGTIHDGVSAIKQGAFDYITKGDEDNEIIPLLAKAVEKVHLRSKLEKLQNKISSRYSFDGMIGLSPVIAETKFLAQKVAQTDVSVLLMGETGTGKEVFAQAIHYAGPRRNRAFVAINCSAIAKDLLESEMFGYKAGAFTGALKNKKGLFEEADEGTIFLDEIGDMDISLQAKLLRVIETHSFIKQGDTKQTSVNVRIIAATNHNLAEDIKVEKFRSDLYYRLGVMKIEIPPLRNRKDDIPLLAASFVDDFSISIKKKILSIDERFIDVLMKYDFPGNIRELKNIVERAVILCDGNRLTPDFLPQDILRGKTDSAHEPVNLSMEELEKAHILHVLKLSGGNKVKAAEVLGIGLTTLYRKLQAYSIE